MKQPFDILTAEGNDQFLKKHGLLVLLQIYVPLVWQKLVNDEQNNMVSILIMKQKSDGNEWDQAEQMQTESYHDSSKKTLLNYYERDLGDR